MSTQRGNVKRSGPPKHKNKQAFNNLKFDSNARSKKIVETDVVQVCEPCQQVIEWKIRFKKYKPIKQAATCNKCKEKNILHSYHTICLGCSHKFGACCKCARVTEVVKEAQEPESIQLKERAALESEVKTLPLRRRKTFYRHMDKLVNVHVDPLEECETEEQLMRRESQIQLQADSAMTHSEYMKVAREKLEELSKNVKLRHTYDDSDDDCFEEDSNEGHE